ncbi:unnamed protein product [marine sediment metagenome]|uniref:Uncharacterized protein n=1 Tax=marine sediment metagenome TaxID=412755 RepID=X1JX99_9ZZZZ
MPKFVEYEHVIRKLEILIEKKFGPSMEDNQSQIFQKRDK